MPRPNLALVPVAYRRIPVLAIGRDVYLDSRLILRKLETLFPSRRHLDATTPQEAFITGLLGRHD
jgi:glutathione S-transferase